MVFLPTGIEGPLEEHHMGAGMRIRQKRAARRQPAGEAITGGLTPRRS